MNQQYTEKTSAVTLKFDSIHPPKNPENSKQFLSLIKKMSGNNMSYEAQILRNLHYARSNYLTAVQISSKGKRFFKGKKISTSGYAQNYRKRKHHAYKLYEKLKADINYPLLTSLDVIKLYLETECTNIT